jgi:hypothetical protein
MAAPTDWTNCQAALQRVFELTETAHQAASDAVATGKAEGFASCCAQLAQALAFAQPMVATVAGVQPVPAELRRLLEGIETRLQALQELTTRQDAATRRALGVLFPADQVREYSRLGSRLGAYGAGNRPAASGFLKA